MKETLEPAPTHLRNVDRCVLEVLIREGFVRRWELGELAGYADGSIGGGLNHLKKLGLVERVASRWAATERGKIAFAIIIGQETRRQCRQTLQHSNGCVEAWP